MTTVLIRPASARRETLAVLVLCAAVLAMSVGTILLRSRTETKRDLPAWQIDARTDLLAGEQGVLADLTIAAGEIAWLSGDGAVPALAGLAEQGIPPFAPLDSDALRGGHVWSQVQGAYLGVTSVPELSGSFLLIPGAAPADEPAQIWLIPGMAPPPADLSQEALITTGWRQVVSQYDASVTRHSQPGDTHRETHDEISE